MHLNSNTINKIFLEIRQIIAKYCEIILVFSRIERESSIFKVGEIELEESYFGARRVRGNAIKFSRIELEMGRGARGKIPVFGMLKRGDKVYTQIVRSPI